MIPGLARRLLEFLAPALRRGEFALGLRQARTWVPLGIVALLCALAIGILLQGLHHTQDISQAYYQSVVDQLESISELKRSDLAQWRKERLGDARVMRGNRPLAEASRRLLSGGQGASDLKTVRYWLRLSYDSYGEYDNIILLDAQGREAVSAMRLEAPVSATLRAQLQAESQEQDPRFVDFFRNEHDGQIYCAVAYAIPGPSGGAKGLGHMVMLIRADAYIYPLIAKWPASSKTGETVIARREGPVVRFLSNLRSIDKAGLGFTLPVERLDVLSVRAARGQHGIAQGVDFEGVPVIGALTTLPDGSWSMVTKMDLAEIETDMNEQVRTIEILVAALSASMLLGSLFMWKLHRSVVARNALEAENTLHRSEAQFRLLIETMTQGLARIDALGTLRYVNSHFLRMLGRGEEEVAGQDIGRFLADKGARQQLCGMARTDGDTGRDFEAVWENGEGDKVFSVVTPVLLPGLDAEGAEKWLLIQDTTQRRFLESQLLQSQKLEAIGQLAAGIAHEINTPAQYVGNNAQFIKGAIEDMLDVCAKARELVLASKQGGTACADVAALEAVLVERDVEYLEAEMPKAIAQTIEGVERITSIVRSVKQFAHPASEAMSTADLNEAMRSTVTVSRNEWKYVADLDLDLDENLPMILCMIGEINQVVLNLIVNAAHAIADAVKDVPEGRGRITLATRHAPPWAEVRVSDTGTGIPPSAQAKIFDPFFTTKEVGRGTGQGLAIARTIVVEKHHGQIFFETEPGVGTTFVVRLPLNRSEEQDR